MLTSYKWLIISALCLQTTAWALECTQNIRPGQVLESHTIMTLTKDQLQAQSKDIPIATGVRATQITYCTYDWNLKLVKASGLWVYPTDFNSMAKHLVSFQHGTEIERALSPSRLKSGESKLALVATGATGFQLAMPDYLGLGESSGLHPYLHEKTEGTVARDFLLSIAELTAQQKDLVQAEQYYLMGYSQGGHATMALFRQLTWDPRFQDKIGAVAPMAGPYDLAGASLDLTLNHPYAHVSNIFTAYTLLAFNEVYQLSPNLGLIFQTGYGEKSAKWFDGVTTFSEVAKEIPATPNEYLKTDFLEGLDPKSTSIGDSQDLARKFKHKLERNSIVGRRFEPRILAKTPIRLIHSPGDDMVAYQNTPRLKSYLESLGAAKVQIVDDIFKRGDQLLGHGDAGMPALMDGFQWIVGIALGR